MRCAVSLLGPMCRLDPTKNTCSVAQRTHRACGAGAGLVLLLAAHAARADAPMKVERLRAELVAPISSPTAKRQLMEIHLTVLGLKRVPRGADIAVGAACKLDKGIVRDRVRAHAVQLHTLRARQTRGFTIALFADHLLRTSPQQCDISTYFLDTHAKQTVQLAEHCLRNGKTRVGSCSTKHGEKKRPKRVADRSSR